MSDTSPSLDSVSLSPSRADLSWGFQAAGTARAERLGSAPRTEERVWKGPGPRFHPQASAGPRASFVHSLIPWVAHQCDGAVATRQAL